MIGNFGRTNGNKRRGNRSKRLLLSGAGIAMALAGPAWAGDVVGRVIDSSEVRSLAGAEVRIVELGRTARTEGDGSYRFPQVAAGTYTLRINYAGALTSETRIVVPEDGEVRFDIALAPENAERTDRILVIGQLASLASSLSRQRSSDTVDSVLTRDGIGQFPDQNVAEAMRRAPGVNVLNDQGEGRFVAVRGLNPNLNAASINGVRVPAPESDIRSVALDVIPSDLIESIEIKKSLTPDMDADSLGGSIEINTTSAFDRNEPLLAVRLESGYNDLRGEWSPRASLDFSTRVGDRLGIAGGLSYTNRKFSTDNVEMDGWSDDPGEVAYADTVEYRDYDVERDRYGASLSFDFDLNNSTKLFARGLYSLFEDQEYRGRLIFEFEEAPASGSPTTATFLSGNTDDLIDGDGPIRVERDMKDRFEVQDIISLAAGGRTDTGPWRFDYLASWSFASETEEGSFDPTNFRRDFEDADELAVTFDYSDFRIPAYSVTTGLSTFLDPSQYEFQDIERTTLSLSEDEESALKFDAKRTFALDQGDFELGFGAKGRFREKSYDAEIDFFETELPLTAADFPGQQTYGLATINPQISWNGPRNYFNANAGSFERNDIDSDFDSAVADYLVKEDILAAYVMGRYDSGPLRVIGGVRVENTTQDVSAALVELVEEGAIRNGVALTEDTVFVTPTAFQRDYTNWLPSVNVRYEAMDDLILRAGAYRTVLRPNPGQIAPRFLVEENDGNEREGEFGNPDLKPYEATNVDVTAEWYFANNAVLQGGVFYKDIENFIADVVFENITFNGVFANEAVIPINGENATVFGVELGYQHVLDFLPGLLRGFVVSANYTYTDAEGEIAGRTVALPASSKHTLNAAVGYVLGPFDVRLAASYRDEYIDELGDDASEDRIVEDHFQVDLTMKYDINDRVQLYAEFVNLNDEPYTAYQNRASGKRLLQYEEYSWTGKLGLRARF